MYLNKQKVMHWLSVYNPKSVLSANCCSVAIGNCKPINWPINFTDPDDIVLIKGQKSFLNDKFAKWMWNFGIYRQYWLLCEDQYQFG